MNSFNTSFMGYDKKEVKSYLDKVISEYEKLLCAKKVTDQKVLELENELEKYKNLESTLNKAMFNAESASEDIKRVARNEAESYINEAKRNANRIINDALIKAERATDDANRLRRNIDVLKRRLKQIIENQLEVIEEIEEIDFDNVKY